MNLNPGPTVRGNATNGAEIMKHYTILIDMHAGAEFRPGNYRYIRSTV